MSGRPFANHVELASHDPAASAAFYREIFGWEPHYDQAMDYHMFVTTPGSGGAFVKLDGDGIKPGYVCVYVGSDDIDADLAKIQSLGGSVMVPRTEIPNMGWFAIFSDPTGNPIGLYSGRNGQSG